MRLQQAHVLAQRPQLVLEADCDFGVEPYADTHKSLDLVLRNGKWYPIVILTCKGTELRIAFDTGFAQATRQLLHDAKVSFAQEDPTCPEMYVVVTYDQHHVEREVLTDQLRAFLGFPFEDAFNEPEFEEEVDSDD